MIHSKEFKAGAARAVAIMNELTDLEVQSAKEGEEIETFRKLCPTAKFDTQKSARLRIERKRALRKELEALLAA